MSVLAIMHPHYAGFARLRLGGSAVGTLHKTLNSASMNPRVRRYHRSPLNGRVLANGVSDVRGVLMQDCDAQHVYRLYDFTTAQLIST